MQDILYEYIQFFVYKPKSTLKINLKMCQIKFSCFAFSRRSKSIGQGIFTFFSTEATDIHTDIQESVSGWENRGVTKTPDTVLPRSGRLTNPLAFLFSSRSSQEASPAKAAGNLSSVNQGLKSSSYKSKQEKGRPMLLMI